MKRLILYLAFSTIFIFIATSKVSGVSLEECEKNASVNVNECIELFSNKVTQLNEQKKTISSQIDQFNTQIKLTQLKIADAESSIAQLEKEIGVLGFRIGYVSENIEKLEELVKKRIVATYQQSFVSNFELLVASNDFSDLILKLQYLKQVQENDKKILASLQETRANYANQKDERETKQAAIEENKNKLLGLRTSLDAQKFEKESFLKVTKNDEARYQNLLIQAQAERAIVFGGGTETFLRDVKQGDSIGSIAVHSVSPGCSSGDHLHFEVHKNGAVDNPNNYLKSGAFQYASGYDESYYGSVNPSGNLAWPLNETVIIHQGYGSHPFAQSIYPSGLHAGIDMYHSSRTVKAVKDGKLFGGSYKCSNGTLLYAKVEHNDGLVTWYLHMIPQ